MPVLPILTFPDPRLRLIAKPVEKITEDTQQIIDSLFMTMAHYGGIGLAATQVGIQQRIIVVDLSKKGHHPLCFINPEIEIEDPTPEKIEEGCLSIPKFYVPVQRPTKIRYQALDRHGNTIQTNQHDDPFLSRCLQHEMDHLNGKLSVDYLSPFKRAWIQKKLEKRKAVKNQ